MAKKKRKSGKTPKGSIAGLARLYTDLRINDAAEIAAQIGMPLEGWLRLVLKDSAEYQLADLADSHATAARLKERYRQLLFEQLADIAVDILAFRQESLPTARAAATRKAAAKRQKARDAAIEYLQGSGNYSAPAEQVWNRLAAELDSPTGTIRRHLGSLKALRTEASRRLKAEREGRAAKDRLR